MAGVSESLAGRVDVTELPTFSALECAQAGLGKDPRDYLVLGGYPAVRSGAVDPDLWYWRTALGDEVDFVIEAGGRFVLIEAKLNESPGIEATKGFKDFREYYGNAAVRGTWVAAPTNASYALSDGNIVHDFVDLTNVL